MFNLKNRLHFCRIVYVLLFTALSLAVTSQNALKEQILSYKTELSKATVDTPFTINKNVGRNSIVTPELLSDFMLFDLDHSYSIKVKKDYEQVLRMELPIADHRSIKLNLFKAEIFTPEFVVTDGQTGEIIEYDAPAIYWGKVEGDEKSMLSLMITDKEISGWIYFKGEEYNLGKLTDSEVHILYKEGSILQRKEFECATTDEHIKIDMGENIDENSERMMDANNCVKMYIEVDNAIYQDKGSGTSSFITGLFSQVAILYNNENINISLNQLVIWNTADPYTSTAIDVQLNQFRTNLNGNFNGDLAHLISYGTGGGVAYLNQVCSGQYSCGASGIYSNYLNVPNYSWSVMVVTHEIGHNLGSRHTHDCVWNGNNTAIDACVANACGGPVPTNGGTIMSYCHVNAVGTNLNLGFGPQPGNIIRNKVYNSSCLSSCSTTPSSCTSTRVQINGTYNIFNPGTGTNIAAPTDNAIRQSINNNNDQKWVITHVGDCKHTVVNVATNKYLDVAGVACGNGSNLHTWPNGPYANSLWYIEQINGNYYFRPSHCESQAVDVYAAGGNSVGTWSFNTTNNNQKFKLNTPQPASCTSTRVQINGTYNIFNQNTGTNIAAPSGNVLRQSPNNNNDQKWVVTHVGDCKHTVVNVATNKYLDVAGVACGNGSNVHTWPNGPYANSLWFIEQINGNYYFRPSHCESQALDVYAAGGTSVGTWTYYTANNYQKFKLNTPNTGPPSCSSGNRVEINGTYTIKNVSSNNNAISPSWSNFNVIMFSSAYSHYNDHKWVITHVGDCKHTVVNVASNRYMDVSEGCSNGSNVHTWPTGPYSNSLWYIEQINGKYYFIPSHCTSRALDQGGTVHLWDYNTSNYNQRWDLIPATSAAPNDKKAARNVMIVEAQQTEASETIDYKLYPVPTGNTLHIKTIDSHDEGMLDISIYDGTGKLMLREKMESINLQGLDVSKLPHSSFYFIKIRDSNDRIVTKKFVKK